MAVVVERTFTVERGSVREFERLSREGIWPYMEARGCKILGLYTVMHGGPTDEVILYTAYDSMAHWESTRLNLEPPGDDVKLKDLQKAALKAGQDRQKLTVRSSTRVLNPITPWVEIPVRPG